MVDVTENISLSNFSTYHCMTVSPQLVFVTEPAAGSATTHPREDLHQFSH